MVGEDAAGMLDARKQMIDEQYMAMRIERFGIGA